jgi:uncharacterized protein YkwD
MSRGRALLLATILSIACTTQASGALTASNGKTRSPKLDPVATIAHAGTGHRKHARAACKSQTKRKGHGKRARTHARKCAHRAKHAKRSHSALGTGTQAGKARTGHTHTGHTRTGNAHTGHASPPGSAPRAQPASQSSSRPEETTVSLGDSAAATIAKVLGSTCENTELMPAAGNLTAVEQATVCLVNQERARDGELPLQLNAQLAQAAEGHSWEMLEDDYFAHVSPGGETPFRRIEATGYIPNSRVGYTLGENIAWGTLSLATPESIVAAWIASPEHLANILNVAYTETAVGVAPAAPPSLAEGQAGGVYSQEFGVIEN